MIKDILREIKYAYQRVVRGYDERIFWEFDSYFSQFVPPLKEFCEYELVDEGLMKNNPRRAKVYKRMLKLIDDFDKMEYQAFYKEPNEVSRMWEYFGKHIAYFWN